MSIPYGFGTSPQWGQFGECVARQLGTVLVDHLNGIGQPDAVAVFVRLRKGSIWFQELIKTIGILLIALRWFNVLTFSQQQLKWYYVH